MQKPTISSELQRFSFQGPYVWLVPCLCFQQALALIHRAHHWKSSGPMYYGDHLLFDRLYSSAHEGVDSLAEKLIGLSVGAAVNPVQFTGVTHQYVLAAYAGSDVDSLTQDELVEISLEAEVEFLALLKTTIAKLRELGALTDGLGDLLQSLASSHEESVYLLKQRLS